jgi:tellurite resistance protein TehA-like permease
MMNDCFSFMGANGMGWMMWGMGLFWLLVLALLVLGVVALIKYLRAEPPAGPR